MPAPANTSLPTIAGTPAVGHALRCFPGVWDDPAATFTYQWRRDASSISGATAATYTLVSADDSHTIDCRVTATGSGGSTDADSDSVTCGASATVTWDPAARQAWEPDTILLFDPDQETTFWNGTIRGWQDAKGTYVSLDECNPWRVGGPFAVEDGRYRRGVRNTSSDGEHAMWLPGAILPSDSFTFEMFALAARDWSGFGDYQTLVTFGLWGPVWLYIRNNVGLGGKPSLRVYTVDDYFEINASAVPLADTWVSLAVTYDGSTLTFLVNGAVQGSHSLTAPYAWYGQDYKGQGGIAILGGGAEADQWTVSDLRVSRVCRTPSVPVAVTAASTATFTSTSTGTVATNLIGGVHHSGTDPDDLAVVDTLGIRISRHDKLESAVPIKTGGTDADHPVAGQSGSYAYNMGPVDHLCDYLLARGQALYLNFGSCPQILGGSIAPYSYAACADPATIGGDWTYWAPDVPSDTAAYAAVCADIYAYITSTYPTLAVPYVGYANEPDLGGGVFWAGTPSQLFAVYHAVADAIRGIGPAQKVGGIELSDPVTNKAAWVTAFFSYCASNSVPLDFASYHHYNADPNYPFLLQKIVGDEAAAAGLAVPDICINEWGWLLAGTHGQIYPYHDGYYWIDDWGAAHLASMLIAYQAAGIKSAEYFNLGAYDLDATGDAATGIFDATNHRPYANANALRLMAMLTGDSLERSQADLENGLFTAATELDGVVSIAAVNLKMRDDRVTELTITLPSSVSALTPTYHLIDASHSDAYDSSPDDGTLQTVTAPTVSGGTITLQMQPRSVHLLQFRGAYIQTGAAAARLYASGERIGGASAKAGAVTARLYATGERTGGTTPVALPVGALKNASVLVNGVDLSDHVKAVEIAISRNAVDFTHMGDAHLRLLPGLSSTTIALSFLQDYGLGEVNDVLTSLVGSAGFPVTVKPHRSYPASPVNPAFTVTCILASFTPISGKVGDVNMADAAFTAISDVTAVTS